MSVDNPQFGRFPVSSGLALPSQEVRLEALNNLESLRRQPYPGRGIVMGLSNEGKIIQIEYVMGRRETTQNRILRITPDQDVITETFDKSMENPEAATTMYRPMTSVDGVHVVSNGDQTDRIAAAFINDVSFEDAMRNESFEPDPSHTPRISAYSVPSPDGFRGELGIVTAWDAHSLHPRRSVFEYPPEKGIGRALQTYTGNGSTDSYQGGAYRLPLTGDFFKIAQEYWQVLNPDYRVAIAVKSIDPSSGNFAVGVINRHHGGNLVETV